MAQYIVTEGHSGLTVLNGLNNNFTELYTGILKGTSPANGLYPGQQLHFIPPREEFVPTPPVEFLNLGAVDFIDYEISPNEELIAVGKGFVCLAWSQNWVNNWKWDAPNDRATFHDATRPVIDLEIGGEAIIDHWTKPGAVPALNFHEINRRGGGIDGLSGHNQYTATVPFNQFKTTIYAGYSSSTVAGAATDEKWWGGSDNVLNGTLNPLIWLHAEEVMGTGNPFLVLESNASSASAYGGIHFKKSRGSYQTKTAVADGDTGGRISWDFWDGNSYETTAHITGVARNTVGDGNAGSSILLRTSATNTAGITTVLEVKDGNQIGFFNVTPVTRPVVPTGSSTDTLITALQNLGLISQA